MRRWVSLAVAALVLGVGAAWAGAGGQPPGGGGEGGGGGAEPELLFLILFSLIPGVWFARKALQAQPASK
ncbi:MAG: hypothetical protein H6706_27145 [Myxococcales bacterium]|nr:hypothetical protein [Myxococcales bacterium]